MTKAIKVVLGVCYAIIIIWLIASWVDITADNCEPNPQHSEYNAFMLMTK